MCQQGRNEVRWRPGQEASLAPRVRTWYRWEANFLYWRMYLWLCWDFSAHSTVIWRPPQRFGTPIVIRRPGNCVPFVHSSLHPCVAVEWENWLNVYSKVWVKSSVLTYLGVCLEIRVFNVRTLGANVAQSLHYPLQTQTFPLPSQSLWAKVRDDIQFQTSKNYWSESSKFILPIHSKSDKNPCMKTRWIVKASLILFLLSFDPEQPPNGTSLHHLTLRHWRGIFVGTSHAIFYCLVGYFQYVPQVVA